MFFLGVHVDRASAVAFSVIIEKRLKNVRHFYTVTAARQSPAAACEDEIAAFYHDPAFSVRKRIYSQDRRPKKDVSARPTIVVAAGPEDRSMIDALRRTDVPVEAVWLTADRPAAPEPEPLRAGVGKDHSASQDMIYNTLGRVLELQRLATSMEGAAADSMLKGLDRLLQSLPERSPLLLAAAAPVWFRENIKYSSAYRTSATCVRKLK